MEIEFYIFVSISEGKTVGEKKEIEWGGKAGTDFVIYGNNKISMSKLRLVLYLYEN